MRAQLCALLTGVGVAPLTDCAFLRITGSDATRWLNGMVTNSTESLQPGEGNYNFLLNAQGRIQGDCYIFREPGTAGPAFLLETAASQIDTIRQLLEKFIIMDDVELQPVPGNWRALTILGPRAPGLVKRYYNSRHAGGLDLTPLRLSFDTQVGNQITTLSAPLVPRIEIRAASPAELAEDLLANGATPVSPEALEHLRILEGTPRYGTDIRNSETARDLPQETGQTRALNFSKGCYLGQEIVERIRSRGAVHRTFTGFQLDGSLPAAGTILTGPEPGADAKPVGELTSVAAIELPEALSPSGEVQLALGYIRREALADAQARGLPLRYPGGVATPIALPWTFGQPSGRPPG